MKRLIPCIALTSLMVALGSAQPLSDEFSRKGKWEVYGFGQAIKIFNILESDANVFGGGLGVGYNVSRYVTLRFDLSINSVELNDEGVLDWFHQTEDSTLYLGNISLDYNILKSRVTPVASLALGVGGMSASKGGTSSTIFDQQLGIGVRWDASERVFTKLMFNLGLWETSNEDHEGWVAAGVSLVVGYKF